jgi:hypothetical protein
MMSSVTFVFTGCKDEREREREREEKMMRMSAVGRWWCGCEEIEEKGKGIEVTRD